MSTSWDPTGYQTAIPGCLIRCWKLVYASTPWLGRE